MLCIHIERGIHPLFRLRVNANARIKAFAAGTASDAEIETDDAQGPLCLRRVRYRIGLESCFLGTMLVDRERYRADELGRLYHERRSVEELHKTVRQTLAVERFHGHSVCKVRQELFAGFVLATLARGFSNHSEDRSLWVNLRHALHTVSRHLDILLLAQAKPVGQVIHRMFDCIARHRYKPHPNCSHRPVGKWHPPKTIPAVS